jgi:hypothetical protein
MTQNPRTQSPWTQSLWQPIRQAPTGVMLLVLYPTGHRALSWLSPGEPGFLGRWWIRLPGGKKAPAEWPVAWQAPEPPPSPEELAYWVEESRS